MASEIRVNKLNSQTGVGTITLSPTGVDISGVTTVSTLRSNIGIFSGTITGEHHGDGSNLTGVASTENIRTNTNATFLQNINVSGTVTATSYGGSGASLTNLPAANLTGALPAISAASLTSVPAANIVGLATAGFSRSGGFGKILQVKQTFKNDTASTNSGTYSAISGLTVAITPSSSSNKILYSGHLYLASSASEAVFRLTRTVGGSETEIALPSGGVGDDEDGTFAHGGGSRYGGHSFEFLDSPSTTNPITYGIKWQTHSGTTYLNRTWDSGWFHGISTITVMEVEE